jgi:3-phosphoglycerate kinase
VQDQPEKPHYVKLEWFSYVSTAGGTLLEWIEGKALPGVAALASR